VFIHFRHSRLRVATERSAAKKECLFDHLVGEGELSRSTAFSSFHSINSRGGRRSLANVRFATESGQLADISICPLCANSDLTRRSKKPRYSIIWSARATSVGARRD
jgi:hypothetical protein